MPARVCYLWILHPMKKVVYLLGPMTGYPDFNRPAFHSATKVLRGAGFSVINPAEMDEEGGEAFEDYTDYYARDIPFLPQADLGVALPGWQASRGAGFEAYTIGILLNRPILQFPQLNRINLDCLPRLTFGTPDAT